MHFWVEVAQIFGNFLGYFEGKIGLLIILISGQTGQTTLVKRRGTISQDWGSFIWLSNFLQKGVLSFSIQISSLWQLFCNLFHSRKPSNEFDQTLFHSFTNERTKKGMNEWTNTFCLRLFRITCFVEQQNNEQFALQIGKLKFFVGILWLAFGTRRPAVDLISTLRS